VDPDGVVRLIGTILAGVPSLPLAPRADTTIRAAVRRPD
jgi:hypothetical protein